MTRGDIERVRHPPGDDPKRFRCFVVVSRQTLLVTIDKSALTDFVGALPVAKLRHLRSALRVALEVE